MALISGKAEGEVFQENVGKNESKFVIFPLDAGFGNTIGNAYRRILLSSIPGYSIVGVKIGDATHEYDTISGLSHDILDIILNLKKVRIGARDSDNPVKSSVISLNLKRGTAFHSKCIEDFSPNFIISNPDVLICNVGPVSDLDVDLYVQYGTGFTLASEIKLGSDVQKNVLPIDGLFSPVVNVKFEVESFFTNNGEECEKLILYVKTDGTSSPEEALSNASKQLLSCVHLILGGKLTEVDQAVIQESYVITNAELTRRKILKKSVKDFPDILSTRSINCLEGAGLKTIADIADKTQDELKNLKSFGAKSLHEIQKLMQHCQLSPLPKK